MNRLKKTETSAICFDCALGDEFYRTTASGESYDAVRMAARRHAEKTGHAVQMETALTTVYNPRKTVKPSIQDGGK